MKKKLTIALAVAAAAAPALMAQDSFIEGKIANPGFEEGSLSGWTSSGFQSQNNNSPSDQGWTKEGTYYAEQWVSQGSKIGSSALKQTLTGLEPGDYEVSALGHGVAQNGNPASVTGFYLIAGNAKTPITSGGEYKVVGTTVDGSLTIGALADNCDGNWIAVDDFKIRYLGRNDDSFKTLLQSKMDEAKAFLGDDPNTLNPDEFAAADALAAAAGADPAKIQQAIEAYSNAMANYKGLYNSISLLHSEILMAKRFLNETDYADKTAALKAIADAEALETRVSSKEERLAAVAEIRRAANEYLSHYKSDWVTVSNGLMWYDEQGNSVQAHGAGFVKVYDTWYMIGEDRSDQWHPDVNMYSSKDLVNWKFVKKIIENHVTHPELGSSRMIERPKIMYCPSTGKFVVWCHWEASNYGASEAGVFVADEVDGDYKFVSGSRPLGVKSRDCNVFIDDDGTAYFISTIEENQHLGLFRLSDDYLEAEEYTVLFRGQKREAPAIVKVDGRYYMLSSACSGWDPNQCKLSSTLDLTSGWSSLSNVGNGTAYDTQAANILTVSGTDGTCYLYVGDRWQDPGLPESKTIIFPIDFADGKCTFDYRRSFDFNPAAGTWRENEAAQDFFDKSGWTLLDCSSEETAKEKAGAANAFDGDPSTIWHTNYSGEKGVAPHHISVDLGEVKEIGGMLYTPRTDHSQNGIARACVLQFSRDGKDWETAAGAQWLPYWSTIYFLPREARYFRFHILDSEYGSAAEFDLCAPNDNIVAPSPLTLKYSLDGGATWTEGTTIEAASGQSVRLAPECDAQGGSWAFATPASFSAGRELTIEKVAVTDAGKYTAIFLAPSGMAVTADYQLTVDGVTNGVQKISADNATVKSTEYYSTDGQRIPAPAEGLSIKVDTLSDGTKSAAKILTTTETSRQR